MSPKSIRLIVRAVGRDDHVVVVRVVVDHLPRQRVEARPQLVEVAQRVRHEPGRGRRGERRRLEHVPAVRPAASPGGRPRRARGRCGRRCGRARAAARAPTARRRPTASPPPSSAAGRTARRSWRCGRRSGACRHAVIAVPGSPARSGRSSGRVQLQHVPRGRRVEPEVAVALAGERGGSPRDAEQIPRDPLRLGRCHDR